MKKSNYKQPLAALIAAAALFGAGTATSLVASPARQIFYDDRFYQGGTEIFENLSGGNGGAFCAFDDLAVSGGITFRNNSATHQGGAIWAEDDLVFAHSGNGTMTFTGNTAAGKPNDVYLADYDGEIIFRSGTYSFDGGLNTERGGEVIFRANSKVSFSQNANNIIGGRTHFSRGSQVEFGAATTSQFLGGISLAAGHTQKLGGNVTIGNSISLASRAGETAKLDLSEATSVDIKPGTQIFVSGLDPKSAKTPLTLISGGKHRLSGIRVGNVVGDTPFWLAKTQLSGTEIVVSATQKTDAQAASDIGGNAAAAMALGAKNELDTATYGEARRNAGAATGELAASFAHVSIARSRAFAGQVTRFMANEISGKTASQENPAVASSFSKDRRVFQAANADGSLPGAAAGSRKESLRAQGWSLELAYLGQRGDVDENSGYNAYDYDYDGAWIGTKKTFSFGTLGAALEYGEGKANGSASEIDSDSVGAGIFIFSPLTNTGTYFLAQSGLSLGDNTLTRRSGNRDFQGNFDSRTWFIQGELGTDFEINSWFKINPYAAFAYTYYSADNFSDGENSYDKTDFSDKEIKPGLRLRSDFSLGEIKTCASLGIAWTHRLSDKDAELQVNRNTTSATIFGNAGSQDFAEANFDIGLSPTDALTISAGYAYKAGKNLEEQNFYVRLGWTF